MVKRKDVRVKVLTAASVMTALWYMVPCSLIEVHRRFRGAYYTTLHPRRLSSSKGKMSLKTKRFQVDVKPLIVFMFQITRHKFVLGTFHA
jgi:hypothetical protein